MGLDLPPSREPLYREVRFMCCHLGGSLHMEADVAGREGARRIYLEKYTGYLFLMHFLIYCCLGRAWSSMVCYGDHPVI